MKFNVAKLKIVPNIREALRRLGYFGLNPRNGEPSYIKRLSRISHYPRFHLYIDDTREQLTFNLHLDQKQPSYQGSRMHSGEYEGDLVEAEAERVKNYFG